MTDFQAFVLLDSLLHLLERKKGLHELFTGRAKGSAPKDTSGSHLLLALLLSPLSSVNPFTPANLKKRKKDKEVVEEGELVPHNEEVPPKLPRIAKDKGRGLSRLRPRKVGMWPRCALKIQGGTLSWSWMG